MKKLRYLLQEAEKERDEQFRLREAEEERQRQLDLDPQNWTKSELKKFIKVLLYFIAFFYPCLYLIDVLIRWARS